MSQASAQGAATAVAPAPAAPSVAAGPPAVVGAPSGTPARVRDTPQQLRLLTVQVIVAGLVVGLVGARRAGNQRAYQLIAVLGVVAGAIGALLVIVSGAISAQL